jgi:hypothetical protein
MPMRNFVIFLLLGMSLAAPSWSETCDSKPFTLGKPATKPVEQPKVVQAKPVAPPKKSNPVGIAPCKTDKDKAAKSG